MAAPHLRRALALALLAGAAAERGAAPPRQARRPPRPRALALAAVAAVVAGSAEEQALADGWETFVSVDENGDGRISVEEYITGVATTPRNPSPNPEVVSRMRLSTIFAEADIDDDLALSPTEFEFSRFLLDEAEGRDVRRRAFADALPKDFQHLFDDTIDELRRGYTRPLSFDSLMASLASLLRKMGMKFTERSRQSMARLFEQVDIIPDGALNLNELDYFYFAARDALTLAMLKDASKRNAPVDDPKSLAEDFVGVFDVNSDGLVDKTEMTRGLRTIFESMTRLSRRSPEEEEAILIAAQQYYHEVDEDSNGFLDTAELANLLSKMKITAQGL